MSSATFHNHPNNIGDRIREAREAVNLTQSQLSRELGVTRQAVGQWESGVTVPDLENLVVLAIVTDQPLDWFVGRIYDKEGRLQTTLDGYASAVIHKKIAQA